jgi:outer membrane cobalamin receptor
MIVTLATLFAAEPITSEVVIVRAERLRAPAADTGSLTLSGAALQDQAAQRLDEVLRVVPGVGLFRRTPSTAANATIQGLSLRPIAPNGAGRALVSLDGVPQNDPFGGWVYWGRYDARLLSEVRVARGGEGAGYGPMALTGTLDLVEARGQPASSQVSFGSSNAARFTTGVSARTVNSVTSIMAVYDVSDGAYGIAKAQRGGVDTRIDSELWAASVVTDLARADGAWSFRAAAFGEGKGAGLADARSRAEGLDVSVARRIEGEWGQARLLFYAQGRDFSNQAVAVAADRATATPSLDQVATPASALGGSLLIEPRKSASWPRLMLDWRRADGETQELLRYIGGAFTRNRVAGGQQDLIGIGLEGHRPLVLWHDRVRIDGLVRLDYWANRRARRVETDRNTGLVTLDARSPDQDGVVGSGALTVRFGALRASAYRTFRPPTLNELHRPFRVGNDVTEANAALEPETLSGLDVGWEIRRPTPNGVIAAASTLYANRLYDPITNVTVATGPGNFPRVGFLPMGGTLRERRNAGRVDALGLEAQVTWTDATEGRQFQLGISITDARIDGGNVLPQLTGKRPAQAPRWSAAALGVWPLGPNNRVSMIVRGEGVRYDDDLNSRRLPAFGALDLRWETKLSNNLTAFISAENVLGQQVITSRTGDGLAGIAQSQHVWVGLRLGSTP